MCLVNGVHSTREVDGDEAQIGEPCRCLSAAIAASTQKRDRHLRVKVADVEENLTKWDVDGAWQGSCGDLFFFANIDQRRSGINDLAPAQDMQLARGSALVRWFHNRRPGSFFDFGWFDELNLTIPLGVSYAQVMKLDDDVVDELTKRLARVEGQVRAVQRMLSEGRECKEVIAQVSAASTALDQVGFRLLSSGMQKCLQDPKRAGKEGFTLEEVERLFLKLA